MAAASLSDLQTIINDGGMKNRIVAALSKTAVNIKYEAVDTANHTARLAFARTILTSDANSIAGQAIKYVIAAYALSNPAAETATILAMSDSDLQSYVDAAVSVFAGG
jgi:hypothetical protein